MLSYTKVYLWAWIALTCYHQTPGHAQIVGFGSCPDKKAVTDFKLKDVSPITLPENRRFT